MGSALLTGAGAAAGGAARMAPAPGEGAAGGGTQV